VSGIIHLLEELAAGHGSQAEGQPNAGRRLQAAQELVEFVGVVEVAFELAIGQFFTNFVKAAGEKIKRGEHFLIGEDDVAPSGIGAARQPPSSLGSTVKPSPRNQWRCPLGRQRESRSPR
jgi:hypothetical protein